MRMIAGARTRGGGGLAAHTGGCSMSDEFGSDVPMSDCQGEHVSEADWKRFRDSPAFIINDGETLRDKFAIAALQGMLASCTNTAACPEAHVYAVRAYNYADAMMDQRKK